MESNNVFVKIAAQIINGQRQVIGPLALDAARKVPGLVFSNSDFEHIKISGEPNIVITGLVMQYERIFGTASIEVCKDAVKEIKPPISQDFLPDILR